MARDLGDKKFVRKNSVQADTLVAQMYTGLIMFSNNKEGAGIIMKGWE